MAKTSHPTSITQQPRSVFALSCWAILLLALFASFIGLGNWQVHRLAWKKALLAHVTARVSAPPQAAPGPAQWPLINADHDEYLRVHVRGELLNDKQTLIWTIGDTGTGFWVMTPLRQADGSIVLINRGFAPETWCGRAAHCAAGPGGEVSITGLVRMSEQGNFIRHNDPVAHSWYARNVQQIAKAQGLSNVAPYFIDADAASPKAAGDNWPQGGKTVLVFPNHHLNYLITWYLLALMVLAGMGYFIYDEVKARRTRV